MFLLIKDRLTSKFFVLTGGETYSANQGGRAREGRCCPPALNRRGRYRGDDKGNLTSYISEHSHMLTLTESSIVHVNTFSNYGMICAFSLSSSLAWFFRTLLGCSGGPYSGTTAPPRQRSCDRGQEYGRSDKPDVLGRYMFLGYVLATALCECMHACMYVCMYVYEIIKK